MQQVTFMSSYLLFYVKTNGFETRRKILHSILCIGLNEYFINTMPDVICHDDYSAYKLTTDGLWMDRLLWFYKLKSYFCVV